jgi:hypothetical protein
VSLKAAENDEHSITESDQLQHRALEFPDSFRRYATFTTRNTAARTRIERYGVAQT